MSAAINQTLVKTQIQSYLNKLDEKTPENTRLIKAVKKAFQWNAFLASELNDPTYANPKATFIFDVKPPEQEITVVAKFIIIDRSLKLNLSKMSLEAKCIFFIPSFK